MTRPDTCVECGVKIDELKNDMSLLKTKLTNSEQLIFNKQLIIDELIQKVKLN